MSNHQKGVNRGKKGSSGSGRQGKTEVPVISNMTQPRNYKEASAGRQGRNPVTSEPKHDLVSCAENDREDQASGTQMEHSTQSEYEELPADRISTVFRMSFLCACKECQHDSNILKEMFNTHPKKDYYIGLLKKQHAEHETKHNVTSKGPSPCAAEFKPPQLNSDIQEDWDCDIQADCDWSSANNEPSSSFSGVSRIHVLLLTTSTRAQPSCHRDY
jgi:hypothetical protein